MYELPAGTPGNVGSRIVPAIKAYHVRRIVHKAIPNVIVVSRPDLLPKPMRAGGRLLSITDLHIKFLTIIMMQSYITLMQSYVMSKRWHN